MKTFMQDIEVTPLLEFVVKNKLRNIGDPDDELISVLRIIFSILQIYKRKRYKGKIYKSWLTMPNDTGVMYFDFWDNKSVESIIAKCFKEAADNSNVLEYNTTANNKNVKYKYYEIALKTSMRKNDKSYPSLKYTSMRKLYISYSVYEKLFSNKK